MKTSAKGRIALAVSEGIVTTAYKDSTGVWTLGIGHTLGAGKPDPKDYIGKTISVQEALDIFEKDIKKYEAAVTRNVKVPLAQHEFDALVHFVYNIGETNFKKSKLLQNLNAGRKAQAFQTGFHGWLIPPEIRSRRDKERRIAQTGNYGSTVAPIYTADRNGRTKYNGPIDLRKYLTSGDAPTSSINTNTNTNKKYLLQIIIEFFSNLFKRS